MEEKSFLWGLSPLFLFLSLVKSSAQPNEMSFARQRLAQERTDWRKNHPPGFFARPAANPDGSVNLFHWKCGVPGRDNTSWAGGLYKLDCFFSSEYPAEPPHCTDFIIL